MSYLSDEELLKMGFKYVGKNVKVSDKASIYNREQIEINDNARIDDFCVLSGSVKIGKYVHITPFCLLAGGSKGIVINDFSTLAYGVFVFTKSDDYLGDYMVNSNIPSKYKNVKEKSILIDRQVIIGARSIILPGANLNEGVSIGANSLVLYETVPWTIYIGSPAKAWKQRNKKILKLEEIFLDEPNGEII